VEGILAGRSFIEKQGRRFHFFISDPETPLAALKPLRFDPDGA